MLEESITSIPSIWAAMNSWFTPTVLFVLLNIMIGTIAITSSLATKKHTEQEKHDQTHHYQNQNHHHQQQQLARSPSMLQRLRSINFYNYRSQEPTIFVDKPQDFDTQFTTLHQPQETPPQQEFYNQPPISRSPSMLQRLKSINLYNYFSHEPTAISSQKAQESHTHYTSQQSYNTQKEEEQEQETCEEEEEEEESDGIQDQEQTLDEIYSKLKGHQVSRSKSDTKPTSDEIPKRLPKKMKKSASAKSAFAHFEEEDIVESRRPATVREGRSGPKLTQVDDAEVDAKADDFINRFKQQLKLQRIDSIMRYKEMIGRGSGK